MVRRFEHKTDGHYKFWEYEQVTNDTARIRWGKIGTETSWSHKVMTGRQGDKLIQEKTDKGYIEVTGNTVHRIKEKGKPAKIDVKKMNRMLGNNNSLI